MTIITPPGPEVYNGPSTDSIFAFVQNVSCVFPARPERPHYNHAVAGAHYISARAKKQAITGDFEEIGLRVDGVRDTGTFRINAVFSAPKITADSAATAAQLNPKIAASYKRRLNGESEEFDIDPANPQGEIRVTYFDPAKRLIRGTFWFVGYNDFGDSVRVDRGEFRLSIR